jgi:hypothetical protein
MTREEYVAPARQRRAQVQQMRAKRMSVRDIARALAVSVREVYRLLGSVVCKLVQPTERLSRLDVQGSPGPSDFGGAVSPVVAPELVGSATEGDDQRDGFVASEPSTAHGGAIAEAIGSEYAVRARTAQPESDVTNAGRGVRGETNAAESSIAYIQRRIREIVAKLREPDPPP